ncbi:zinc finger protein RFP-like [Pseudophryne corroboree]|uniref:zinc finger protein RFP-like n=1 Tax=Pseudophryne corroboree TaxID=495146 RepID=UPI00308195A3
MASTALELELKCSVCLHIYTDPITLLCGHTFCKQCIEKMSRASFSLSCPECRHIIPLDSELHRNTKMCNLVEHLTSHPLKKDGRTDACFYCESAAGKLCLDCETPLCSKHQERHTELVQHVLTELSTDLKSRKCPVHKDLLRYYCTDDRLYICASCGLIGDHKGHTVEKLSDLSNKEKEILLPLGVLLANRKSEMKNNVKLVRHHKAGLLEKAAAMRNQVVGLVGDMKKELEAVEHRLLSEITKEKEEVVDQVSLVIQQLEAQISELEDEMTQVQRLCDSTDPLTVLTRKASHISRANSLLYAQENLHVRELNAEMISVSLLSSVSKFINGLPSLQKKRGFHTQGATASLLPVSNVTVDLPSSFVLSLGGADINSPWSTTSAMALSSGQHYWEVETSDKSYWAVGVSYAKENDCTLGCSPDSWCLRLTNHKQYQAVHDSQAVSVLTNSTVKALGVYLDYEAGTVSFYQLSNSVKHLCSMHAKFTQPLHFVVCTDKAEWLKIRN